MARSGDASEAAGAPDDTDEADDADDADDADRAEGEEAEGEEAAGEEAEGGVAEGEAGDGEGEGDGEEPAPRPLLLPRAVWGLALAGLLVRLAISTRSIDALDRLFIPDDSYYTLAIARSLADGNGPSVDGSTLTSGFQPLLAFLVAPVAVVTSSLTALIRSALVLGAFVDTGTALLLGRLGFRVGGRVAGVVATALWALSPVAIANSLNGLETALAVFFQLCLVELWWWARDDGDPTRFAVAGAVAGLAVLARVDSLILVGAFAVIQLLRPPRRPALIAMGAAAAVLAPWWLYCTFKFGSPIPESGGAVREIVSSFHGIALPESLGWAAGTVFGAPVADLPWLRDFLFDQPLVAVVAWMLVAGAMAWAGWLAWSRGPRLDPLLGLSVHGLGVLCLYTVLVPAVWFFGRYLAPVQAVVTLLLALAASAVWATARTKASTVLVVAAALLALAAAATTLRYLVAEPVGTSDVGLHGAKGYRGAAQDVLSLAPPGAVIGSLQSGALAYFAPPGVRVVNLDGVVDGEAAEAVRQRRLGEFARRRGVTHVADWQFNVNNFLNAAGNPGPTRDDLRLVGHARRQGADRFLLYEIVWPDTARRQVAEAARR